MKKLLAITALLTLTTTSAFAATSGTLLLSGIVPQKVSVTVTATGVASALDLSTSQSDTKIGTVNEQSNSKSGYKITISSANLGKLKRTDGADVFAYTLKYSGSSVGLSSAAGTTLTNSSGTVANVNKDLNISYIGVNAETMVEGTYNDTLTVAIAAN